VHPHVTCKVVDEHGKTVPVNTKGELLTKGYLVMLGTRPAL
jgi:fatty-acyl-CoA synthase